MIMIIMSTMTDSTTTPIITDTNDNDNHENHHHKWFPLESNPTLMNQYIKTMGWDIQQYHIIDVYSTDDWALEMISQPVIAVLLLYPLTQIQLKYEQSEKEQLMKSTTTNSSSNSNNIPNDIWFMKQRIGNACGTIGLLHAMMNVPKYIHQFVSEPLVKPNSWLDKFIQQTTSSEDSNSKKKDPIEIAEILENDTMIASLHDAATSSNENQTERGDINDDIITHFIAFVRSNDSTSNNIVYELDGRKVQPIPHIVPSSSSSSNLLYDACTIIKEQFMARDPNELRFTILALAPNQDDEEKMNE